jgi:hypothetical protein
MLKSKTTMNEPTKTKVSAHFDSSSDRSFAPLSATTPVFASGAGVNEAAPSNASRPSVAVLALPRRAFWLVCTSVIATSLFTVRDVSYIKYGNVSSDV